MISLIAATENSWWEHYLFDVNGIKTILYYQKPRDSYQYPDMGVDKDTMQTIISKLKELRGVQLIPVT